MAQLEIIFRSDYLFESFSLFHLSVLIWLDFSVMIHCMSLSCKPNIYVSWSTSELRVRLAPLNRFKPSSIIFYWPFQGGTSYVDLLCFCSVLYLLCLCARLFICALWSPAGKGLTSWLSFVVSTVSLSLSNWYPGSGVVLDCIDSWSLHPYLLRKPPCELNNVSCFINHIYGEDFLFNCTQVGRTSDFMTAPT